jgi:quinol-cytochrome oxidoreductase complex cytochrome b subunit
MSSIGNWLDERLGWKNIWQTVFVRKVPKVNWWYTLGSATLFVGIMQGVTGILLSIYYVPSPDDAYNSVQYITNQLPAGWFIRGLHHWGASALLVLAVIHMIRVIMFGAYKFPREMTWFTGIGLLLIAVGFGFTGYLLPWDQKAYWATTVGTRIAGVVPWLGSAILRIARGGPELSALTLVRFFGVHVWFLPVVGVSFIALHIYLIIKLGISAPPKRKE